MFSAGTVRARRVRNGIIGAAMVLASVVGVAPALAGAADTPQPNAEPFVDVSAGSVDLARAQAGAAAASGPDTSRGLSFNRVAMRSVLAGAPDNSRGTGSLTIDLPAPDGSTMSFNVWESAIMAPELAAAFPEITTYSGQGIDDPAATIVFDVTPHGFHAQVLSPTGAWYIDPAAMGDDVVHESFFRSDRGSPEQPFIEGTLELEVDRLEQRSPQARAAARSGTQLRTLRTVVSATSAYTALNGGTRALAQASIVTAVSRVSGIYVTEIATQLQLVAGNKNLVYVSGNGAGCPSVPVPPTSADDCDPFTNSGLGGDLLDRNQVVVDSFIGDANYDIGHVFTEDSGLAFLGSAGVTGEKAKGATGNPRSNDGFWVDFVAHEMGHQLGGSHTYNGVKSGCNTRADDIELRVEPGSGSTIQGYAGLCGDDDLQKANEGQSGDGTNASDPYFHSRSFDQIIAHLAKIEVSKTATGNSVPTVNAGLDVTVPAQTPFFLTAAGNDADGDTLTYNYEQRDGGTGSALNDPPVSDGPLFRSFLPTTSRTSFFPRLSEVAAGNTSQNAACAAPDGKQKKALCWSQFLVPTGTSRDMNFRATVRDNSAKGGGVNTDDTVVKVAGAAGPFTLTAPNGGESLSGSTTVTWNVGGTAVAPVSASTVSVRMSTDGGLTFPTELLANTANDGSAEVSLSKSSSQVRLMVHSGDFTNGAGFFDISDANLTAGDGTTPPSSGFTSVNPARLLETRSGPGLETVDGEFEGDGRVVDRDTIEFQVTGRGGIPEGAEAASLNVVAIFADGPGFLTVYPCDQDRPNPAASVNYNGNDVRPNAVLTKLSEDGTVCIYTSRETDLVVDANGAFAAGSGFTSVNPARLLETRSGPGLETVDGEFEGDGRVVDRDTIEFQVTGRGGIPEGAEAASLNVVAIFADGPGFLTVYPCDQDRPNPAASVNYNGNDVRPNAVLTKLSETGTACIYTSRETDLVVDANGAFTSGPTTPPSTEDEEDEYEEDGFELTAAAFKEGAKIPVRLTCDGADISPSLAWTSAPEGTQEYALIMDDPDADGFVHWVVYGIPGSVQELSEGGSTSEFMQGTNDFSSNNTGYRGPCPPPGEAHRYNLTLHALSAPIDLKPGVPVEAVRDAISRSTIEKIVLTGVYTRQSATVSANVQAVFDKTNAERKSRGIPLLSMQAQLTEAAEAHAADQSNVGCGKLSHDGTDGSNLGDRVTRADYDWRAVGENIACKSSTPSEAMTSWMNSTGHRENILSQDYTEIGIAAALDAFGDMYWVQVFGTPS